VAQVHGVLHLKRQQPDPAPELEQFISIGNHGASGRLYRFAQHTYYLPELRFAVVQDFGTRIEQPVGDLLQFGLGGLAALFEFHVQSVLSNL
jgi:hypothetical protein